MLTDLIHWLTHKHVDELFLFLWAFLTLDGPRYMIAKIAVLLWDCFFGVGRQRNYDYCPTVSVILAGHNEGDTVEATLRSVWGSYPKLEIIVIDDGSGDNMYDVARNFAKTHSGVLVLKTPSRMGKSPACNFGLRYASGEVIILLDTDSHLGPNAIWEIVQPLKDPEVGAVSAAIFARNTWHGLVTWLQAYEYLSSIFVGRIISARFNILGIVSGAFGAFRRELLHAVGTDVGPPEDLDLTLRIRKAGFRIAYAPYAQCLTDLPETWWALFKQRRRWEQGGVVRNYMRKHADLISLNNFSWSNIALVVENFIFNFVCPYVILLYVIWFSVVFGPEEIFYVFAATYVAYLLTEVVQIIAVMFYSDDLRRDLPVCAIFPLVPFYQMFQLFIRVWANTEELLFRSSFEDNYVPLKSRVATWRW